MLYLTPELGGKTVLENKKLEIFMEIFRVKYWKEGVWLECYV